MGTYISSQHRHVLFSCAGSKMPSTWMSFYIFHTVSAKVNWSEFSKLMKFKNCELYLWLLSLLGENKRRRRVFHYSTRRKIERWSYTIIQWYGIQLLISNCHDRDFRYHLSRMHHCSDLKCLYATDLTISIISSSQKKWTYSLELLRFCVAVTKFVSDWKIDCDSFESIVWIWRGGMETVLRFNWFNSAVLSRIAVS